MRGVTGVIAVVVASAMFGVPTHAEGKTSTGLYAPFPSLSGDQHIQRYVGDFGVAVPASKVRGGTTLGTTLKATGPPPAVTPSARALSATDSDRDLLVGGLIALVVGALCIGMIDWRATARRGPPIS